MKTPVFSGNGAASAAPFLLSADKQSQIPKEHRANPGLPKSSSSSESRGLLVYGKIRSAPRRVTRASSATDRRPAQKDRENPAKPRYILTEIGVGYRLAEERE